jgi:non-specific serine/threonine protein kinase
VDREKLAAVLAHWKALEAGRRDGGLSMAEGLRLLSGATPDTGAPEALPEETREWSQVRSGDWLRDTPRDTAATRRRSSRSGTAGTGARRCDRISSPASPGCISSAGSAWAPAWPTTWVWARPCRSSPLLRLRAEAPSAPPALLVLPASLLGNWQAEAARFAPGLRLFLAHPSATDAGALAAAARDPAAALAGIDLVLTTYGLLPKLPWLRERTWSVAILDEAQAIKNPGTASNAREGLRSRHSIALHRTPVENSPRRPLVALDFLTLGGSFAPPVHDRFAKNSPQPLPAPTPAAPPLAP